MSDWNDGYDVGYADGKRDGRAARAAAPPVEPGCPECGLVGAHNPRCASRWDVPSPDRVAGLREADQDEWRRRIVEHLGPQRMSLYMSKDIDRMATGAVIAAALLAEPVPLDVERLARVLHADLCDGSKSHHHDDCEGLAKRYAAEYARLSETPDA